MRTHLAEVRPDILYVFNGRLACVRPAIRAAQQAGVDVRVHERGGVIGRYTVTNGTYPHDLAAYGKLIQSHWRESPLPEIDKHRIASEWFAARRSGRPQGWYSFTAGQCGGIPSDWNLAAVKIVIFNSSSDEYAAIREWEGGAYDNQELAAATIAADLQDDLDVRLILRVHPNLSHVRNSQTRALEALRGKYPNLTIISAEDSASTYDLLDAADLVLVFNSTIGIEAIHMGKPVFVLSRAAYECLLTNPVTSHSELIDCIRKRTFRLPHIANQGSQASASRYGFYNATGGFPFEICEQKGPFDLRLKGQHIVPNNFIPIWRIRGATAFRREALRRLGGVMLRTFNNFAKTWR